MDRFTKLAALGLMLLLAAFGTALAAAPNLLQYQGRLTDNAGVALNGAFNTTFTIYSDSAGTASLWTETRSVTYANGLFSLTLGTGTAIPATVSNGADRFLGIKVAPDAADMLPRQRLAAVAFTLRAAEADHATTATLASLATTATTATSATTATTATNATHATTADVVTSAPVTVTQVNNGSVTVALSTTAEVIAVTITAPVAGIIHVNATGMCNLSHAAGVSHWFRYRVSTATGDAGTGAGSNLFQVPAAGAAGVYYSAVAAQMSYSVAAGTYTYYLNGMATGEAFTVFWPVLTATFVPNGSVAIPQAAPARATAPPGAGDATKP